MEEPLNDVLASAAVAGESRYLYAENNLPASSDVEHLRWKTLIDSDGEKIGTIENIETDEDTGRVEFLEVGRGGFLGFGAERFLVPVTRIVHVEDKTVQIDRPLPQLEGVPAYDPDRLGDQEYCDEVRNWWCEPVTDAVPGDSSDA
jgi:sporulation protein YlmC with PRC-barrel domain